MLIGDGLVSLIWLLNTVIGNNGGMLHMIFLRTAQASALLVLLEIVFEVMAMTSYGTRVQVFNSWVGWGVTPAVITSVATNGGTSTGAVVTTGWLATASDFKYLMWKDTAAVTQVATDFALTTVLSVNGYDANASTATYVSLLSGVLEIVVLVLAWGPFAAWYQNQADLLAAPEFDEYGCDADGNDVDGNPCDGAADESAYDEYGCNSSGMDVYGNECPAPAY